MLYRIPVPLPTFNPSSLMHFRLSCRHQYILPSHRRGNFTITHEVPLHTFSNQPRLAVSALIVFLASWIILPLVDFHMSGIIQHLLFVWPFSFEVYPCCWGTQCHDFSCTVQWHCTVIPVSSSLPLWMNTGFGLSFCSVSFLIADLFINADLTLNLDLTLPSLDLRL